MQNRAINSAGLRHDQWEVCVCEGGGAQDSKNIGEKMWKEKKVNYSQARLSTKLSLF